MPREIAFVTSETETMFGDDAPSFEVAVIHHTGCGTGFLADDAFRSGYGARLTTGGLPFDDVETAGHAVVDPTATVSADVQLVRSSSAIPDRVIVSGHVYDVDTGRVTAVA